MTYEDALAWLYGFTDLERGVGHSSQEAYEAGPLRTRRLLAALGNPHLGFKCAHIAGSKGKGSVSALVAAVATAAGLRVGTYTQPHLHSFRERFVIDGQPIGPAAFAVQCKRLQPWVERIEGETSSTGTFSTFDLATVLALSWFAEQEVDLAVIEVGLGGRLDATCVVQPSVVGITTIVLEHTHLLGRTLRAIAGEKAGIVKPGIPVILADQVDEALTVLEGACHSAQAPLTVAKPLLWNGEVAWRGSRPLAILEAPDGSGPLAIALVGPHQRQNAAVAWQMCRVLANLGLPIDHRAIRAGFTATRWPGRLETVSTRPLTVVDGAHTVEALEAIITGMRETFKVHRGPVIFGALRDKRVPAMLNAVRGYATALFLFRPDHPRAWAPDQMIRRYRLDENCEVTPSAASALHRAQALCRHTEAVLATGSLAIAADVRAAAGVPHETDPQLSRRI